MTPFVFLSALALSVFTFEIISFLTQSRFRPGRLAGIQADAPFTVPAQRSTGWAILAVLLPARFNPEHPQTQAGIVTWLRRAGYPLDSPGEFYAHAIQVFSGFLIVGGLLAGLLFSMGQPLPGIMIAAVFVFLGLRRPYTRLKTLTHRRAEGMRSNMLTGLAMLNALMSSGVGVQEALRRTASVGGPFCNLLGLLIARMEVEDVRRALDTVKAHLPAPEDIESQLFLRDVEAFFVHNRPLLASVQALQEAIHRNVIEATEARAALVRQRSGLFGVMAVVGLVLSLIAPFAQIFG
ncbi:MAG: hypothetical protein HUU38_06025 [Anaerolineales bacterium]|nr:hypothetical protein [Anaerolineales bacterium]